MIKGEKGDTVRVTGKTDIYSEDYQIGDELVVDGTWYGGIQTTNSLGVPVSLEEEEYEIIKKAALAAASGNGDVLSPVCLTDHLPDSYIWKDSAGLVTKLMSEASGSEKLCVRMDVVPAGAYSAKYHSHSVQEEFFLILEGRGTLRLNDREYQVEKGSFISKQAGTAHTFFNSGEEPLAILDISTVQQEDTCYYPDEDIYLQKSGTNRRVFSGDQLMKGWSSEPNDGGGGETI